MHDRAVLLVTQGLNAAAHCACTPSTAGQAEPEPEGRGKNKYLASPALPCELLVRLVAPNVAHTGGYLFLKMEASREPVARVLPHGDQFPGIAEHFWCALSVLNPSVVRVVTSGVVSANLFLAGFDPVTSSFKNR